MPAAERGWGVRRCNALAGGKPQPLHGQCCACSGGSALGCRTRSFFPDYDCAPSRPIRLSISDIFSQAGEKIRPFSLKTDPFWLNLGKEMYIRPVLFNLSNRNPVTNSRGHPWVCSPCFHSSFCSLWASPHSSGLLSPRGPWRRARCWIQPLCWCFLVLLLPLHGCFVAISTRCGKHHPRALTSPKRKVQISAVLLTKVQEKPPQL